MPKTSFVLDEAGLFPPGTKVGVYSRHIDVFTPPGGDPLSTATVGSDGKVRFTGLVEDAPYFAAAEVELPPVQVGDDVDAPKRKEWHVVAFTPKSEESLAHPDLRSTIPEVTARRVREAEAATEARRAAERKDPLAASPAPGKTVAPNRVTGSRSSAPKAQADLEARRTPQHAVRGPQRSDTLDGEAVPVSIPAEPSPTERQEDVPKRTKQRSATKTGEAERAPTKKRAKRAKQPSRAKQSSATRKGEATQKSRRAQKPRSRAKRRT